MPDWEKCDVRFNVWLESDGDVALSRWRVALLDEIGKTGSITSAAAAMKVPYRVAWTRVREMETRLGQTLVVGHVGGAGGGGAQLTPEAQSIIRRFRAFEQGMDSELLARYREHFASTPIEDSAGDPDSNKSV